MKKLPLALFLLLLASTAAAWPAIAPYPGRSTADWTDRLTKLAPDDPEQYFLLAEEVADAADGDADLALARHLFALSAVLSPVHLGPSACLALADLESASAERARLRALATLLAQRRGRPPLVVEQPQGIASLNAPPFMLVGLSEAFSYYRRGYGERALTTLRQAGAMELLENNDDLVPGGSRRFLEDCRRYRGGDLRPSLTNRELINMLQFEAALLGGSHRAWSGDLMLNHHDPLIEVNPDRLEETLGVDARRAIYRGGRWVQP